MIVPVYNRKDRFLQTISSIIKQDYRPLEVVVVDDGSDEFSVLDLDLDIEGMDVRVLRQENKGAPSARNIGFENSKGQYIIFWDADVVASSDMLSKMNQALNTFPEASYAYSNFVWGRKKIQSQPFCANDLKKQNYIHTTSLLRRSAFCGFDETLQRFQDWDLWLTMLAHGNYGVHVNEYLFTVQTDGTMSSWLPSFAYKAPFKWLPGIRKKVASYQKAKDVVRRKHKLI